MATASLSITPAWVQAAPASKSFFAENTTSSYMEYGFSDATPVGTFQYHLLRPGGRISYQTGHTFNALYVRISDLNVPGTPTTLPLTITVEQ